MNACGCVPIKLYYGYWNLNFTYHPAQNVTLNFFSNCLKLLTSLACCADTGMGCGSRPRVLEALSAVGGGPCRFEQVTVLIMSVLQNVVLKQVSLVCLLISAEPSVSQSVHSFTNVSSLETTR